MRERWLQSICKEIENFLQNMAIDDGDPAQVVAWKQRGKWPLPCQMLFVLKPLTQSQQHRTDVHEEYKHKSRMVICGNFATWGEHSTTTTNLDAPLLRLMISLACSNGKLKWPDHQGKIYQGTPFSVEPDITSKQMFVASMMHSSSHSPALRDTPDVTCPSDAPMDQKRREVVQYDLPSESIDLVLDVLVHSSSIFPGRL